MKTWLYKLKRAEIIKKLYKLLFQMIGILPANKKLIIFESYLGRQYSCNPRAIYEYMKDHYPEYTMYWSVDPRYIRNFANKDLKIIKRFSVKWLLMLASAKYWVSNSRMPHWLPKPKHTIYVQTWHGTPLKKLALDMEEVYIGGMDAEKYKKDFLEESGRWDYLIAPNEYSSEIFRRAFGFKNEMIESGYPRNDYLIKMKDADIEELKKRLHLPTGKKVILYAPTWRDDQFNERGEYRFRLQLDLRKMKERLGNDYIILLRLHYLIKDAVDISEYKGFAYDFSHHEDIRELYVLSDLLITDYSSVFFDYSILKRPMIFYVYDIEDYRDRLRGFYFDFEKTAPGPLVKTTEGVIEEIKKMEEANFQLPHNFGVFYERFCSWEDGKASMRVVETVWGRR